MAINGSPIPNGYDNTYDTAEVSRPDMDRRANWAEENPEAPQYIRNKEEGGGSGGDCGYSCSEGWVTLMDESVTTTVFEGISYARGNLAYFEPITVDTIKVTFNGTEYTCVGKPTPLGDMEYGAPYDEDTQSNDWTEYPFFILGTYGHGNTIGTETAGTYQVKIETSEVAVETSECFRNAVEQLTQPLFVFASPMLGGGHLNTPFINIYNAFRQGRRVIAYTANEASEITDVSRNTLAGGGSVVGYGHTYTALTDDAYPSYTEGTSGGGGAI